MEYRIAESNVYAVDGEGVVHACTLTVKEKVIEKREIESITPKLGKDVLELPPNTRKATLDELLKIFNVSEKNPIKFDADLHETLITPPEEETRDDNVQQADAGEETQVNQQAETKTAAKKTSAKAKTKE